MTLEQKFIKISDNGIAVIPWNGQKWITEGYVARVASARLEPRVSRLWRKDGEQVTLKTTISVFTARLVPHITGWRDWTLAIRKVRRRKNDRRDIPWVVECPYPRGSGRFYLNSRYIALFPRGARLRVSRYDIGKDEPANPIVVTVGTKKDERCIGLVMALRSHAVCLLDPRENARERL